MDIVSLVFWYGMNLARDLVLLEGMIQVVSEDLNNGGVIGASTAIRK